MKKQKVMKMETNVILHQHEIKNALASKHLKFNYLAVQENLI